VPGSPPLSFVADLAGYLVVANLLSLAVLAGRHAVPPEVLWPTLPLLVAAAVVGNIAGMWVARRSRHRHSIVPSSFWSFLQAL
jgi:uncharacterized protein